MTYDISTGCLCWISEECVRRSLNLIRDYYRDIVDFGDSPQPVNYGVEFLLSLSEGSPADEFSSVETDYAIDYDEFDSMLLDETPHRSDYKLEVARAYSQSDGETISSRWLEL